MRWLPLGLLMILMLGSPLYASDEKDPDTITSDVDTSEPEEESKELIAELDLLELLDLLENMNALASMEDTE